MLAHGDSGLSKEWTRASLWLCVKRRKFRLRLHGIGYVQIRLGSDPLWYGSLCLHGTGSKLERYCSLWDHLHIWTHLVPDSRSDPYRIHQVRVNTRLIRASFYPFQTDPVPCKRCFNVSSSCQKSLSNLFFCSLNVDTGMILLFVD